MPEDHADKTQSGPETLHLRVRNVSKRFAGVHALDRVSLEVGLGEVVAVIGENGAGKSTLMKILGGVYQPDDGEILVRDKTIEIRSVADSRRAGIAFIHQELNVVDNLDVAGNVFLGREYLKAGPLRLLDRSRMEVETQPYLDQLGLRVSPGTPLGQLSIAQQQMVEIAKALSLKAQILIMDEPTSSLTLSETDKLMQVVHELREQGVGVIYISHRLSEVTHLADRVVALRDGKNAGSLAKSEISHDKMVRLMVGRDLNAFQKTSEPSAAAPVRLSVSNLRTRRYAHRQVSFDLHEGEVLGFAGLVGAGRTEVARALFGVERPLGGKVTLDGHVITIASAREAIAQGIYLAPEDRRASGLIVDMTIKENITLPSLFRYAPAGLIDLRAEWAGASSAAHSLGVKASSVDFLVRNLSGGNQQKVVLAKWLSLEPKVLIFDEPTRGIDVGAKAEIYALMRDLAQQRVAILMISSDMEEVLGQSDRVAVMHEGSITGILNRDQMTEEAIMNLAVGRPMEPTI